MNALTDQQWNEYEERGCLVLGRVLEDQALAELRERIDQIMLCLLYTSDAADE